MKTNNIHKSFILFTSIAILTMGQAYSESLTGIKRTVDCKVTEQTFSYVGSSTTTSASIKKRSPSKVIPNTSIDQFIIIDDSTTKSLCGCQADTIIDQELQKRFCVRASVD